MHVSLCMVSSKAFHSRNTTHTPAKTTGDCLDHTDVAVCWQEANCGKAEMSAHSCSYMRYSLGHTDVVVYRQLRPATWQLRQS
jgi:hypothetical protein